MCQHCGYPGTGHYVGCNRPRTEAKQAERARLEASIAAAWAEWEATRCYTLITRRYSTIAESDSGERIGTWDPTAGANRGTIRGATVARDYADWLAALDTLRIGQSA